MSVQDPTQLPSLAQTEIIETATGGTLATIQQNTPFTVFSLANNGSPTLDITFTNPVQLTILNFTNWFPTIPDGIDYLFIEQPLGIQVFTSNTASKLAVTTINPSQPISRLIIVAGAGASNFWVEFEAIFIFNAPNTQAISGSGTAGNAGAGDQFILDGLQNDIKDIQTRLDTQDTFIKDGLTNNLKDLTDSNNNFASAIGGFVTDVSQANNDTSNNVVQQLVQSNLDGINALVDAIMKSNPITAGLPSDLVNTIATEIKNVILEIINVIGTDIKNEITGVEGSVFVPFYNSVNGLASAVKSQGDVINNLLQGKYDSLDSFYAALRQNSANSTVLQFGQNAFTLIYLILTYFKARTSTAEIVLNQLMLSKDTPNINDINTNILAYIRGFKNYDELTTDLAKFGLNKSHVNELLSTKSLLAALGDIKTALQRKLISDTEHDTLLTQYGISPGNIELIKSVYPLLPSPSDMTRMADKHIFAPDIPQIFGQNTEVDNGYINSMELWGIDEDWTRKLWASHWSLPGLQETFDLWHRGLISDDELNVYFKLTDILPFFREKLKLLSHNLIGRVDIRRFYHVGVYTQKDVYDAYIKLGFSADDATKQTQFTVENDRLSELPKQTKIRALTETMVVKAYKEGIISQQDAINRLGKVGYLPQDAGLILELETQTATLNKTVDKTQLYHDKAVALILKSYGDGVISRNDARNDLIAIGIPSGQADIELYYSEIERVVHLKTLIINHVRTAYTKGQIDKQSATNLMLSNGFGMSEIELLFEELDITKSLRSKELTLPQVTSLVKKGIITPQQFAQELANMGYNDTHINWLVQETIGV